jgi:hypothetical protein
MTREGRQIIYLVLTSDIPNSETNVLVFHSLHIETCTGNGSTSDIAQ